jgi:hypothetical protein
MGSGHSYPITDAKVIIFHTGAFSNLFGVNLIVPPDRIHNIMAYFLKLASSTLCGLHTEI